MKRTRIFQRNVEQRDYHSLCKCGQPITLFFNGGELDARTWRTFETTQPWVIYTYGLTHDLWWPFWNSTRWLGYAKIECHCSICGEREVLKLKMPRFGTIVDRGYHPLRVAFLAQHQHPLQRTAPETWAQPLANPDAHGDTLDILRDVLTKIVRRTPATTEN